MSEHEWTENQIWTDIFERVEQLVQLAMPVPAGMAAIIDSCQAYFPHDDWEKFRSLDYGDCTELAAWLAAILKREPLPRDTRGIWFGIFNPTDPGRGTTSDLYLTGSRVYSAADAYCDWARDPYYLPRGRHAGSRILDAMYRIAYDSQGGLEDTAEYPLCLAYGGLALKQVLLQLDHRLLLGEAEEVGAAVGFDEGDCIVLGVIDHTGFIPAGEPAFP